ncbi:MAG: hypothetical protein KKH94_01920 [Candidatus Omnitrophica bacterium]|nr:hypothetical protein [Candidatus Omnitrophota bacterium]
MMRIHTKAFALSCGIALGIVICIKTLVCVFFGFGSDGLTMMASNCPGYSLSIVGSVIGLIYGFLKGAIIGGLIALIYNKLFVKL